ncbi:MAG TPA: hypothetical protein ENL08_04830, partial [Bacteroidetes bacterium]|nr:hypothetical protein [Bacteroidota bacterium]
MAFKPSDKRKAPDPQVNPDVTPVMNLMVVLIPLLLNVASFVQLGLLEYSPPLIEEAAPSDELGGGESSQEPGAEAKLNLTLNITFDGFEISMFGATSGDDFITIPKLPDGHYDLDSLHKELIRIREEVI